MVFGIGQEIKNNGEFGELEYVMFQKYYQRIIKKTGNAYKRWLHTSEKINVFVYGHSLDIPDGDIIRDFVNNNRARLFIFYYNQDALNKIVINLISIFQKDRLITLTNENKVNFLGVNETEKVKQILNTKNSNWIID